jgi:hypothetical protein
MIDFLTNERDKVNWHDMECVVLIIMSHGETNGIYGTDGKLTKLKDMTDIFNSSQFMFNTTGVTRGAGTAYTSRAPEFTSCFLVGFVLPDL